MSDPTPSPKPKADADALAHRLKQKLSKERPRPLLLVLGAMFVCIVFLALLAWWMYPRPLPAQVGVFALDTLASDEEKPTVQAQLLLPPGDKDLRRLAGLELVFVDGRFILPPGEEPRTVRATSDAQGRASVAWPQNGKSPMQEFQVRQIDVDRKKASSDTARQFVWPKSAKLIVVDVEETLADLDPDQWSKDPPEPIALRKGAAEALLALQGDRKIVYASITALDGRTFVKVRGWLVSKSQGPAAVPVGPLLGRSSYPSETPVSDERRGLLQQLRQRFDGEIVVVVRSPDAARVSQDMGIRTIVLGENGLDWKDVK